VTKTSPAGADHWAVSTRTQGGVRSATASLPSVEMALLGIPEGFTPAEIESWLRDLAGVALETSRSDDSERPIPQLLHHILTGLLFSQTELWSHTGQPLPCAAVFVDTPQGIAFGWVARARVVLLANGEPFEPQWVIVRDEAGQEAMSAVLPAGSHALLTLEYWPRGEDGKQAPASVDAEWGQTLANRAPVAPLPASGSAPVTLPVVPSAVRSAHPAGAARAAAAVPAARPATREPAPSDPPAGVPTGQPGLAPDPTRPVSLDQPDAAQKLPSTFHPSAQTFAMPSLPGSPGGGATAEPPAQVEVAPEPGSRGPEASGPGEGHPVGRWLSKLLGIGRRTPREAEARSDSARPVGEARSEPEPGERVTRLEADPGERHVASLPGEPSRVPAEGPGEPTLAERQRAQPPDIDEPHALPPQRLHEAPLVAEPVERARRGLAAVGLHEVLGPNAALPSRAARLEPPGAPRTSRPPASGPRLEGLTAVSGPSGPIRPGPRERLTPEALSPGQPPYPLLEVTRTAPPPRRTPIQIEREPVGADASFAIPKLPPREPPRPFKVAVPTAADSLPPARPGVGVKPAPPAASGPAPPAPPPAVPEPPAEFLAEFAAASERPAVAEPPPEQGPPIVTVTPGPARESPAGASSAQPRWPSPPSLPSVKRAVAVSPPVPPVPPAAPAPAPSGPPADPAAGAAEPPAPPPVAPVLRAPTEAAPVPVAESELPSLLRELPLPTPAEEDVLDGLLVATPASGGRGRRGTWPELDLDRPRRVPLWRNPWVVVPFVLVFAGLGWLVGHSQAPDNDVHGTPMSRLLRSVGLGGARFTATIETDPPGAFISLDGSDLGRRTPATLELVPGEHKLTLSLNELGQVEVTVTGDRGQKVEVSEALHGSLEVSALDNSLPVKMSLDGEPQGFLPVRVDQLPPGLHELQFTGPSMQPWAQNVSIPIRQTVKVKARPMLSPATGVVEVQAMLNDEGGSAPLEGATIYVDGDFKGSTPARLELPRGPHSLKVVYLGVAAPVQVIDLPGGNRRFATFQFGLDSDLPPLKLVEGYASIPRGRTTIVQATLDGLDWKDVREAWLHVRTGEGLWRRYQATIEEGPRGTLLSVPFPANLPDGPGRVQWYLSAATSQGDDFYTEMQRSNRP